MKFLVGYTGGYSTMTLSFCKKSHPVNQLAGLIAAVVFLTAPVTRADDHLHQRPRYLLHAGDVITLNYRYTPEFDQTVTIQPDGYVTLQVVGSIKVAGLTLDQAHDEIISKEADRLNHPELEIVLKDFEHPFIVVAGEVAKPGKFELREDTTAMQAIMLAGGFKDSARDTKVMLFRRINQQTAEVRQLDLHNIRNTSELERDTALEPGDMLLVTRNKLDHFSHFMKATNLGLYFDPATIP
jgi:polysaccharide biosynthesis/export protein